MITGLFGKPNSGKSTFFNAATLLNVPMASYPFTTIKANFGIAYLRTKCVCREFGVHDNPMNSRCVNGVRFIPIRLIDVAGLVPGASRGRGLGNKFLDDLRQADCLAHVVDASGSTDAEGKVLPPGSHDPLTDVEFVEKEFDLWVFNIIEKDWGRMSRTSENEGKRIIGLLAEKLTGLSIREAEIAKAISNLGLNPEKPTNFTMDHLFQFCREVRRLSKPALIAANKIDLLTSRENVERLKATGREVIPCAAEAELVLRRAAERGLIEYYPGDEDFRILGGPKLTPEQKEALEIVREKVLIPWKGTGIQQSINAAYFSLMRCIVVYPVEDETKLSDKKGNILPDAYIMKEGSITIDLARAIHSDLAQGFQHAIDARTGNRLGTGHQLKNLDVIKIVSWGKRG